MDNAGALLPLVLLFLAFYVFIIRPARNRQRAQQRLVQQLTVGSEVMTTSGLYGRVTQINDDSIHLEVAPGVTLRWAKPAVARVLTATEDEAYDAGLDPDDVDRADDLDRDDGPSGRAGLDPSEADRPDERPGSPTENESGPKTSMPDQSEPKHS